MSLFLWLYAGMVVFAAVLSAFTDTPSLFRVPEDPAVLWLSLALGAAFAAAVVLVSRALESVPWYRAMAAMLKRLMTAPELLGPELDGEKAFVVALYSSVGEEALFRGWLQPWLIAHAGALLDAPGSPLATSVGVLAASLVFGGIHLPRVPELRPWTAFALVVGLGFGVLAAWSECLAAPIVAHLLINWLNLKRLIAFPLEDDPGRLP